MASENALLIWFSNKGESNGFWINLVNVNILIMYHVHHIPCDVIKYYSDKSSVVSF